jgi:hypothetical protein
VVFAGKDPAKNRRDFVPLFDKLRAMAGQVKKHSFDQVYK